MVKKKKNKTKKVGIGICIAIVILLLGVGGFIVRQLYTPFFGVKETVYVYVDDKKNYNDLLLQLQSAAQIKDVGLFKKLASAVKYPEKMRTGRYEIRPDMTCKELLQNLRNGNQAPAKITFNNIRVKEDLAERVGGQFMFGPQALLEKLNDPQTCASYSLDTSTILCLFIPNTYEMYWNMPVDRFLQRMKKEYDRFWSEERLAKARAIPLTPVQVSTLASIVEEETAVKEEYPVVAGLYINRLKQGMLLQADPTVKFAVGDFALKRVLFVHLETESPYNTYKYEGLPPGPIRVASIGGIDGVLNYTHHHYLYMCAKEDFSGRHNFATTLMEHTRNAKRYQEALNRNNIR